MPMVTSYNHTNPDALPLFIFFFLDKLPLFIDTRNSNLIHLKRYLIFHLDPTRFLFNSNYCNLNFSVCYYILVI